MEKMMLRACIEALIGTSSDEAAQANTCELRRSAVRCATGLENKATNRKTKRGKRFESWALDTVHLDDFR